VSILRSMKKDLVDVESLRILYEQLKMRLEFQQQSIDKMNGRISTLYRRLNSTGDDYVESQQEYSPADPLQAAEEESKRQHSDQKPFRQPHQLPTTTSPT